MNSKEKKYNNYMSPLTEALSCDDPIFSVKLRQVDLLNYARKVGKKPTELSKEEIGQFVEGGYEKLEQVRGF